MSFFDLLDGLLTTLDVPFFEGQPEFERSPPETFITYNVYDVPKLYGCGRELYTTYYVTINIYTCGERNGADNCVHAGIVACNLGEAVITLFTENGFVRQSGSFGLSNDFPDYYHRILDFAYSRELSD